MARLNVTYNDGTSESVALGAFSQIAAKRRFGLEATKSDDPEVALFGVFVEIKGPQAGRRSNLAHAAILAGDLEVVDPFDEWLGTIETFGISGAEDEDEDPPTAESSESSPASPPTSD